MGKWYGPVGALILSGCVTTGGNCPPIVKYTRSEQTQIAKELRGIPRDAEIWVVITDYDKTRQACARP
jgi:hypothetical protein